MSAEQIVEDHPHLKLDDIHAAEAFAADYLAKQMVAMWWLNPTPSNIAEGFERESIKDCINFLSYAKGSCGEVRTQIYIGIEIEYINKETGDNWIKETTEISLMLTGLIKTKRRFLK